MTERGSAKHGSRVDELIKQRAKSGERGSPGESHVEEYRAEEGWTESDEVVDARPSHDPIELRADIARYLDRIVFPARRDQLLDDAVARHAPETVLSSLQTLPSDRLFETVEQIWEALGGKRERRG